MLENLKIKQLQNEIKELEKENSDLKRQYAVAKEEELFKNAQYYIGSKSDFLYRAIPLSMITTPYFFKRESMQKHATACFMPEFLAHVKKRADEVWDKFPQLHFAMLCEAVVPCSSGIMFVLSDPYRTIQTLPVTTLSIDEANTYIGQIVIARLVIPVDYEKDQLFALKSIKKTNLNEGYVQPKDWTILREHIQTTGLEACQKALRQIQWAMEHKYHSSKNGDIHSVSKWFSDKELRIITDTRILCFKIHNNIIWYAEDHTSKEVGPTTMYVSQVTLHEKCKFDASVKDIAFMMLGEENFEFWA